MHTEGLETYPNPRQQEGSWNISSQATKASEVEQKLGMKVRTMVCSLWSTVHRQYSIVNTL